MTNRQDQSPATTTRPATMPQRILVTGSTVELKNLEERLQNLQDNGMLEEALGLKVDTIEVSSVSEFLNDRVFLYYIEETGKIAEKELESASKENQDNQEVTWVFTFDLKGAVPGNDSEITAKLLNSLQKLQVKDQPSANVKLVTTQDQTKPSISSELKIHHDYVFELASHQNVGGPIEVDGELEGSETNFIDQDCWGMIKAENRRAASQAGDTVLPGGKGTAIFILDNYSSNKEAAFEDNNSPIDFLIEVTVEQSEEKALLSQIEPLQVMPIDIKKYISQTDNNDWKKPAGVDNIPGDLNLKAPDSSNRFVPSNSLAPYHGRLIAGLIRHMAPEATIVMVKAFNQNCQASTITLLKALESIYGLLDSDNNYTNQAGKKLFSENREDRKVIINCSFGTLNSRSEEVDSYHLINMCERLCQKGAVIVAAAGNDSYYLRPYNPQEPAAYGYFPYWNFPGCFNQIIAVAACGNTTPEYAVFSNHGNIAACGNYLTMDAGPEFSRSDISNGTRYVKWSGTSFATALVSGAAAILLDDGAEPHNKNKKGVKQILWQSARRSDIWGQAPILNLQTAYELLKSKQNSGLSAK